MLTDASLWLVPGEDFADGVDDREDAEHRAGIYVYGPLPF